MVVDLKSTGEPRQVLGEAHVVIKDDWWRIRLARWVIRFSPVWRVPKLR
jgi:hypothetical protein